MDPSFNPPFLGRIQRPHFCKDAIKIDEFCKSFSIEVSELIINPPNKPNMVMAVSMDMPFSAAQEVTEICSVDQLTCEGESTGKRDPGLGRFETGPDGKTNFPNIHADLSGGWDGSINEQAAVMLKSLRSLKRRKHIHNRSANKSQGYFRNLRYTNEVRLESDKNKPKVMYAMSGFRSLEPVVCVRLYQPMKFLLGNKGNRKLGCHSMFFMNQEVLCLGRNLLTEFRDVIRCSNDRLVVSHCHKMRSRARHITAQEVYPSGMFCIDGVFYVDERNPESIDYSEPIREWAAEHGVTNLPRRSMDQVRFGDLSVRLGYPYVYLHQGRCQHMVVFSDVRLFHPGYDGDARSYPRTVATRREQHQSCNVCDRLNAKWMTTDHELTPTDPTYYCESCFNDFNYSRRSRPLSEFKAFPLSLDMRIDEFNK